MANDELLQLLNNRFDSIEKRFDNIDNELRSIKYQLNEMQQDQQNDVIATLKVIDKRMTHISYDIDHLRNKTSKNEMDVARIEKQLQS